MGLFDFINNKGLLGSGNNLNDFLSGLEIGLFNRGGKITQFIASINNNGIVHPNRFEIEFHGPQSFTINAAANRRLSMSCEECSLPAQAYSSQEHRTHGPIRKIPYTQTYTGIFQMTFRLSKDMFERQLFELWQTKIMNPNTNNFGFYDDYISDIKITQLSDQDEPIYAIKLIECYPEQITELSLAQNRNNEYHKQAVTFSFRKWVALNPHTGDPFFDPISLDTSFLNNINAFSSGGNLIENLISNSTTNLGNRLGINLGAKMRKFF